MKTKIIVLTIVLRTKNDAKTNGEVSIMLRNKKYFSIIFGFLLFFSLIVQGNPVYGDNTGYEPENPGIKDEQTAEGDLGMVRSEEHTSELQSRGHLVCRLLLE